MKNKKLLVILLLLLALGIAAVSVIFWKVSRGTHEEGPGISHYTCPMHPQIHEDHPGDCPICHMKLVPVYKESPSVSPLPPAGEGGPPEAGRVREEGGVTISPDRQQLIGLTTGLVEKKIVTKEIRTVGRVAFDPDLAIAQREFVEIVKNVPSLKNASIQRLRLLGMSPEEIRDLERRGRPEAHLTLPEPGGPVWVYASLYEDEAPIVQTGATAKVAFGGETFSGTVRAVDPVIDPMTRTARARIEVPEAGGKLRPESYLTVSLEINLGEQMTVPKSAVIDTGERQIVFRVLEGTRFETKEIKLGPEAGETRVVLEGLSPGDVVATSAAFLIDSESQLKAAISGMGTTPSCPDGQAWDQTMNMCMPKAGS